MEGPGARSIAGGGWRGLDRYRTCAITISLPSTAPGYGVEDWPPANVSTHAHRHRSLGLRSFSCPQRQDPTQKWWGEPGEGGRGPDLRQRGSSPRAGGGSASSGNGDATEGRIGNLDNQRGSGPRPIDPPESPVDGTVLGAEPREEMPEHYSFA